MERRFNNIFILRREFKLLGFFKSDFYQTLMHDEA